MTSSMIQSLKKNNECLLAYATVVGLKDTTTAERKDQQQQKTTDDCPSLFFKTILTSLNEANWSSDK